jgi:hypothetical protein
VRTRSWAIAPSDFAHEQHGVIPLTLEHSTDLVGAVDYLELRSSDQSMWLVATLDSIDLDRPREIHVSAEIEPWPDGAMLRSVGLCDATAHIGAVPVRILPGGLRDARGCGWATYYEQALIDRALDAVKRRRAGAPLFIRGHSPTVTPTFDVRQRPPALHYSSPQASRILSVC